ncbi:hypothetical protein [Arthrobacter sp. L77]|uniref:hypothetical protein n=1 Tax=Arthrobacter sp. L77 TaxID=1496689 RepID=UPI0018CF2A31|nr:hypothetical protein [Arthrobacter sp. L77]
MTESRVWRLVSGARVSPARNAKILVAGLSVSTVLGITAALTAAHQAQADPETPPPTIPTEQASPEVPTAPPAPVPPPAAVPAPAPAPAPAPPAVNAPPAPSVPNGTSRGSGG